MVPLVAAILTLAALHILLGGISIALGVASTIKAYVWMAHSVSPIWSGAFFIITGLLGIWSTRRNIIYIILCFSAFSLVSVFTAVVSIQLLRQGLVNHTTDGHTFTKENIDIVIKMALGIAGVEGLVSIVSFVSGCLYHKMVRKAMFQKREGTFYVQVFGEKDVIVVTKHCESGKPDQYHKENIASA